MYKFTNEEALYEQSFKFYQLGNTEETTSEEEELLVEIIGPLGDIREYGGFFVLQTNGWSINSVLDLLPMFKDVGDKNAEKALFMIKLLGKYSEEFIDAVSSMDNISNEEIETFKKYLEND